MSKQSLKTTEKLSVLAEASERQREASDPAASAWVGASAGSGKTKVLTDRILRLLLPREDGRLGTKPEKILALTFTKAGANEMSLRLSSRLSEWAVMEEQKLIEDMEKNLLGRLPSIKEIESARKLFARVIDAPGGLKIMTIHSFCQSVLGRFPIEAGLQPHFKALEESEAVELLAAAQKEILSRAGKSPASPMANALSNISASMNEEQFGLALKAMASERRQIADILKRVKNIDGLYTNLCMTLGIKAGQNIAEAERGFCNSKDMDESALRAAIALLANGSKTDQEKAAPLQDFLDAKDRAPFLNAYKRVFLTNEDMPRDRLATKAVTNADPNVLNALLAEQKRVMEFVEICKAINCAALTRDLFLIGHEVLAYYKHVKKTRVVLDFDDMILRTLELLKGEAPKLQGKNVNDWIMFKLDAGLDHILVDEAQDTNPEQWDIIRLLSSEFFTGLGASDETRTIFVVGDDKQSIFSFQRAAPEKFRAMQDYFDKQLKEADQNLRKVNMDTSFRSVDAVLRTVDGVFADPRLAQSLSSENYRPHNAKREEQAGIVEVWPLLKTIGGGKGGDQDDSQMAFDGWFVPDTLIESQSGASQMATRIADTIQGWLKTGEKLESYDRPIQAGDIMVLLKSRTPFVGQLVRALKSRGVPVSGVDRMVLSEQIAVQDLCAAASFALLPDDDLTLATLLKSPLVGMSEDDLQKLALHRPSSLWETLKKNGDMKIVGWMEQLISRAGTDHPYEFFSKLVQEQCPAGNYNGMQAIRTRLGEDALDPLDEFLNVTLSYESTHGAGLQSFLQWQAYNENQIKRELEEAGGAVRIMTVHGAKGLQAPIVFLPDTVRVGGRKGDSIYWPQKTGLPVPFYNASKSAAPQPVLAAKTAIDTREEAEYYRLLYVAMTRAEERLYVGGYLGKKSPGPETAYWYDDIRTAFENRIAGVIRAPSGIQDENGEDIPVLRLVEKAKTPADNTNKKNKGAKSREATALPSWVTAPMPFEPAPPRPLAPSRPSASDAPAQSLLASTDEFRFRRGLATHRLLQTLPDLPPAQRNAAAEKFLGRAALGLAPELQKEIAAETIAVLNDENFRDIFGPESMAEVPVTGMLDDHTLISGQIDRILIRADDILIIDYKTNRPPPERVEDVPEIYVKQMKAYADTLRKIYPNREVRCALLWTQRAILMPVSV